jgi:hypothetical protein
MALYSKYTSAIERFIDKEPLDFKQNPDYTYMLEHLDDICIRDARMKLKHVMNNNFVSKEDVIEFIKLNDSLGRPRINHIFDDIYSSFGSLQYVYQSILAINHFKTLASSVDVVEIGGGYGGLSLAMKFFGPRLGLEIKTYTIIDLPSPLKLQKKYLEKLGVSDVTFSDASGYGQDVKGDFLIANYSWTEIDPEHRKEYQRILFPKLKHGFILWNHKGLFDFGFKCEAIPSPFDTPGNYIVTF